MKIGQPLAASPSPKSYRVLDRQARSEAVRCKLCAVSCERAASGFLKYFLAIKGRLSSYRKRGKVLGPVVGAYGEMSDEVYLIAEAAAEELATEL